MPTHRFLFVRQICQFEKNQRDMIIIRNRKCLSHFGFICRDGHSKFNDVFFIDWQQSSLQVITGCPAARLMSWTLTITIVVLGTHVEASDKVPVFTDTPKSRIGLVTQFLKPLEKCLGSVWYFVHISPV